MSVAFGKHCIKLSGTACMIQVHMRQDEIPDIVDGQSTLCQCR